MPNAFSARDPSGIRRMFSQIAPAYDLNNRLHSLGLDRGWRRATVRAAGVGASDKVLDLACGTGDLALAFARAGAQQVVGVDFCREMLDIARQRAERAGLQMIRWASADALILPWAEGIFDVVSVAFGLRNFADLQRGLAECARVLRPGGRLVVLEFDGTGPRGLLGPLVRFYVRRVLPRTAAILARDRAGAYDYLQRSVREFLSAEELADAIRQAGFCGVHTQPLALGMAAVHAGIKP